MNRYTCCHDEAVSMATAIFSLLLELAIWWRVFVSLVPVLSRVLPSVFIPGGSFTGDSGLQMELPSPLEGDSGEEGIVSKSTLFSRSSLIFAVTKRPWVGDGFLELCMGLLPLEPLCELELLLFPLQFPLPLLELLPVLPVLLLRCLLPILNRAKGSCAGCGGVAVASF